jgi:hypothetical protein
MRKLAEREGFEPSRRFRLHDFQSCSFDHSDTALHLVKTQTGLSNYYGKFRATHSRFLFVMNRNAYIRCAFVGPLAIQPR